MQVAGREPVQGRIAGPGEQAGQPGQFGGERAVRDVVLGVPLHLGEALLAAGEAHVLVGQRHVPSGVREQAADQGQGVVSRGARAGPVGQFLAVRQDFLLAAL